MRAGHIDAYLDRIGAARPADLDAASLRELQLRHLTTVPFENLSIHIGEPIVLVPAALFDKIVRCGRGGFCYELNGAFAALLRGLGYDAEMLPAKVFRDDGSLGPPFDHMVLRVNLDEPWLVDVGFGRHARHPLRISAEPQADPEGEFTVTETPDGDLDVRHDGTPVYRVESRPRELTDFAPTCWWQATSPDSHFTRSLICSLPTPSGRVSLSGTTLYETIDGERTETRLDDATALRTYRSRFGIVLDKVPSVHQE